MKHSFLSLLLLVPIAVGLSSCTTAPSKSTGSSTGSGTAAAAKPHSSTGFWGKPKKEPTRSNLLSDINYVMKQPPHKYPDRVERDAQLAVMKDHIKSPGDRHSLQPGDTVAIQSVRYPDLDRTVTVDRLGNIVYPFLGEAKVTGMTATALAEWITNVLSKDDAYTDPVITVTLTNSLQEYIYVLGEVKTPGKIPVIGSMTILEAMSLAGGQTYDGKMGNVLLIRGTQNPPAVIKLDLKNMYKPTSPKELISFPLIAGDVLFIPPTRFADVNRTFEKFYNILRPFLQIEQGVALYDSIDSYLWGPASGVGGRSVISIDGIGTTLRR